MRGGLRRRFRVTKLATLVHAMLPAFSGKIPDRIVQMPAARVESMRAGTAQKPGRVLPTSGRTSSSAPCQRCRGWKRRSRRLLETTKTDEEAMAAPAIIGLSIPGTASGIL